VDIIIIWLNGGFAVLNLILSFIVLFSNPRRVANISGSLFLFFIAFWNAANAYYCYSPSLMTMRMTYSSAVLFIVTCQLFIHYFSKFHLPRWILVLLSLIALFFFVAAQWTPAIIIHVVDVSDLNAEWELGYLFVPYSIFLFSLVFLILIELIAAYRKSRGLHKLQLQYLLLGLSAFAVIGTTVSLVLPVVGIFFLNNLDSPSTIFISGAFTYVILIHRLFDIRRLLARLVLGVIVFFVLLSLNGLFIVRLYPHFNITVAAETSLMCALAGVYVVFLLLKKTKAYQVVSSLIGSPEVEIFRESMQTMLGILDRDNLICFIAETLQNHYRLHRIQIFWAMTSSGTNGRKFPLVMDTGDIMAVSITDKTTDVLRPIKHPSRTLMHLHKESQADISSYLPVVLNTHLAEALQQKSKILVYEEYQQDRSLSSTDPISQYLQEQRATVVVPCLIRGELQGVVMLGEKPKGDAFTKEDVDSIQTFLMQAGIALHNAFLYEDAISDGLTKLFNRRYLQARLAEQFEIANRYDKTFAVLMIDVDHFKSVNDRYGHQAGDCVLMAIAECIRKHVRASDTTARYGGEEFTVLLQDFHQATSLNIRERIQKTLILADRIRSAVEHLPIDSGQQSLQVTISIGGCIFDKAYAFSNVQDLLQCADQALYQAKREGRNRVFLWDKESYLPIEPGMVTTSSTALITD
jgi:diguanylate cyclase (GGDEF)-like protein